MFQQSKKESRNRPGVARKVPGGLGSQISWHSNMKVVRLSASRTGRLYRQEMFLVLIFTRAWVHPRTLVRSEGICHWKIVLGTVRLVAQRLNHYATPGPFQQSNLKINSLRRAFSFRRQEQPYIWESFLCAICKNKARSHQTHTDNHFGSSVCAKHQSMQQVNGFGRNCGRSTMNSERIYEQFWF